MDNLLSSCTSGGCGAKLDPSELSKVLLGLPKIDDERLIVGYDSKDDASVYMIDEKRSIVNTVDFFSPMVDDPKIFGRIAAANALSDIYAMGARPLVALNMVCFPKDMELDILQSVLMGGAEKVAEASAVLSGGHSIYDKELKYGLAVTGIVDNDKIIRNDTPRIGDKLILTKPLGVGIVMAAHRAALASAEAVDNAVCSMQRLNMSVSQRMAKYDVSACTDITGFGFLAHALEMASDRVSIRIYCDEIPCIDEAHAYAEEYLLTAAGQRNRKHMATKCNVEKLPFALQEILFDPQTLGGLLISIEKDQAYDLLAEIRSEDSQARIVGEVLEKCNDIFVF